MHQKATNRALQRRKSKGGDNIKVTSVYRTKGKRKPRSMLQIREALREMMENELIEIENKKLHKKLKAKQNKQQLNTGRTSENGPSSRSQSVEPKMPDESKAVRNVKPSFSNKVKPLSKSNGDGKVSPANNDMNKSTDEEPQKPVLVTEILKEDKENQLILPAIREEKTQEEIQLNTPYIVKRDSSNKESKDKHVLVAKERSSDSGFKDEISAKIEQVSDSKSDSVTENKHKGLHPATRKSPRSMQTSPAFKTPSPKPKSPKTNSQKHAQNNGAQFKASTPKLPAIVIEKAPEENNDKTDDVILNSNKVEEEPVSPSLQQSMKFVNERIQDRYYFLV